MNQSKLGRFIGVIQTLTMREPAAHADTAETFRLYGRLHLESKSADIVLSAKR